MKAFVLTILFMFFVSNPVFSNETKEASITKVDLTFEQAYELMLVNNNALKSANEEIKQKKYEKKSAIGKYFPKVLLNASYAHFSEPITVTSHIPYLGSAETLIQKENTLFLGGGIVWNIFTGGKIIQNHKAAIARLDGMNEKYKQIHGDLLTQLVKTYFGLRLAQDVIEVKTQYKGAVKKHLDDAILLEKEGIISKSERLHAEVAYIQAERDLRSAIRDKNVTEEALKNLIKEKKVDLKNVEVNPNSLLFLYNLDLLSLDEYKQKALTQNPLLKQLNVKKRLVDAKHKAQLANYSPTVSLFAYDVLAQSDLSHQIPRWGVGGSVNFLVFDGLSRYNDTQATKINKQVVEYEVQDIQNNIETLVTKQYEELNKFKEQYISLGKSVESATEALRTVDLGFREGFKTSLDVTDAQLALLGSKIGRLHALYNYDLTLSELLKTTGEPEEIFTYMENSTKEQL